MPLQISCPHCDASFNVADTMSGKKVRCKSCQEIFVVKESRAPEVEEVEEEPQERRPKKVDQRLQTKPKPASSSSSGTRRRDDDDDEDEAPRRRPKKAAKKKQGAPVGLIIGAVAGGVFLLAGVVGLVVYLAVGKSAPATQVAAGPNGGQQALAAMQPNPAQAMMPGAQNNAGQAANPAQNNAGQPANAAQANAGQPANAAQARVQPNQGQQGEAVPPPPGPATPPVKSNNNLRYAWQGGPHVYSMKIEADTDDSVETQEGNCIINVRQTDSARKAAGSERKGTGTGFVVNPNGYLVTCAHVAADAIKIDVALGGKVYQANVLAVDHENDLALIQIQAQGLATLTLGNSDAIKIGQDVRALGFPLSSVLGESIKATRGTLAGETVIDGQKVFQVDASINPGNSGGPLVSETGAVIGVNIAKLTGDTISNVGFATKVNEVKKLLASKNVAFSADGWTEKLEGGTLVERVSPAVALLTVIMGQNTAENTFRLDARGHLRSQHKAKPGATGRTVTVNRSVNNTNIVDVNSLGEILTEITPGIELPYMLGDLGHLFVKPVPPDGRPRWGREKEGTFDIDVEQNPGSGRPPNIPFPIPGRGRPFGARPFGPAMPQQKANAQKIKFQARLKDNYTRGAMTGDLIRIERHFEFSITAVGAPFSLKITMDGPLNFDVKNGLIHDLEYKGTHNTTEQGKSANVAFSVNYKLLEGAERDLALKATAPAANQNAGLKGNQNTKPKAEDKPLTDAEVPALVAILTKQEHFPCMKALKQLAEAQPTARRAEVVKALEGVLPNTDQFLRNGAIKALGVWGTKDSVAGLLKFLEDGNVFTRKETMTTLTKLQGEQAIEPLAKRLIPFEDRGDASKALQAFGAKAEKAVLPYLKHEDWGVRLEACKVLAAIGTKAGSSAALAGALRDDNGLVKMEAQKAATAVAGRP